MHDSRPITAALVALSIISGSVALTVGRSSPAEATTPPPFFNLANERLRFGPSPDDGCNDGCPDFLNDSISPAGTPSQPFYFNATANEWFKLTFSRSPLNIAVGWGQDTGPSPAWHGNPAASLKISGDAGLPDAFGLTVSNTGFTTTRTVAPADTSASPRSAPVGSEGAVRGFGELQSQISVAVDAVAATAESATLRITQNVLLGESASFVRIRTTVENVTGSPIENVNLWVGTRDDYVGGDDNPNNRRGTLIDGAFSLATDATAPTNAIQVESGSEGVLFYTTTEGARTVSAGDCCQFSQVVARNPAASGHPIQYSSDNAYGVYLPIGSLGAGLSRTVTWFYAAGDLLSLGAVAQAVESAAEVEDGATSTSTPAPTGSAPSPIPGPDGDLPVVSPGSASGSVGGAPVVPTPARPNGGTAEFRVGTVETRIDVAVAGAGSVGGTGAAPVIRAVRDRVATISGGGMRPGDIAEVWLPLLGGGSRQVALLPIGADGTFDGALPFTGELDGQGPLPIGNHTIQLFGRDTNGQLTVLNIGVRIEQPGPLTPEPDRGQGAPPTLTPGQSLATNAGVPTPVTVTPLPDARSTRIQGAGWLMDVDVPEGTVTDDAGAPLIEIVNGTDSVVRGTGFLPGTRAYVWLMSTPTFLGQVTVNADGTFSGAVPIDGVPAGQHTLQLSGVGTDGFVRAANLGVVLLGDGMPRPTRINAGEGPARVPTGVPASALLALGGLALGVAVTRQRAGLVR
jgi:hypothetical protein